MVLVDRLFDRRACPRPPGRRCPAAGRPDRPAGREELAARIGPAVLLGAGHVDRPRGDQGDQHVLVDAAVVFVAVVELLEVAAEPVRESRVDRRDRLAEAPLAQGRPAAARVVGDHQANRSSCAPAHERGLAQPRVAHHGHVLGVDVAVGFEVVHRRLRPQAQAPIAPTRPAETVVLPCGEQRMDAVLEAVVEVGIDVAVVDRGQAVAAIENHLDRPAGCCVPRDFSVAPVVVTRRSSGRCAPTTSRA